MAYWLSSACRPSVQQTQAESEVPGPKNKRGTYYKATTTRCKSPNASGATHSVWDYHFQRGFRQKWHSIN